MDYLPLDIIPLSPSEHPYECLSFTPYGDINFDESDGTFVRTWDIKKAGITLSERRKGQSGWDDDIFDVDGVTLTVYVTDSRIIFRCDQYNRVGKSVGFDAASFLIASASNAIRQRNANRKTEGTTLAGHIRYEWLKDASYNNLRILVTRVKDISFECFGVDPVEWLLSITLKNESQAFEILDEVWKRSAAYKLNLPFDYNDEERNTLEDIARRGIRSESAYVTDEDLELFGSTYEEKTLPAPQHP